MHKDQHGREEWNSDDRENHTPWMITLADLLSLLLTFFVLLFSMRSVPHDTWQAVVSSFSDTFQGVRSAVGAPPAVTARLKNTDVQAGLGLGYLEGVLRAQTAGREGFEDLQILRRSDRLIMALPASIVFEPQTASLRPDYEAALGLLADALRTVPNRVSVFGYTRFTAKDSKEAANGLGAWALSAERAQQVALLLHGAGYDAPITVMGFGATRFDLINPTLDLDKRYDLGERIEIVVTEEGRDLKPYVAF